MSTPFFQKSKSPYILFILFSVSQNLGDLNFFFCFHLWCIVFLILLNFRCKPWGPKLGLLSSEFLHVCAGSHEAYCLRTILVLFLVSYRILKFGLLVLWQFSRASSQIPGLIVAFVPKDIWVICLPGLSCQLALSSSFCGRGTSIFWRFSLPSCKPRNAFMPYLGTGLYCG